MSSSPRRANGASYWGQTPGLTPGDGFRHLFARGRRTISRPKGEMPASGHGGGGPTCRATLERDLPEPVGVPEVCAVAPRPLHEVRRAVVDKASAGAIIGA
jgi:hypothetical protein